jgi:hypothetical protein
MKNGELVSTKQRKQQTLTMESKETELLVHADSVPTAKEAA